MSLCTEELRLYHFLKIIYVFIYCKSTVLQQKIFLKICEKMWVSILGRINLWWGAPLWCGGQSHLEWQTSSEFWTGVFGEKISSLNITLAGRRRLLMGGRQDDQQGVCWGNRWTGVWPSPKVVGWQWYGKRQKRPDGLGEWTWRLRARASSGLIYMLWPE